MNTLVMNIINNQVQYSPNENPIPYHIENDTIYLDIEKNTELRLNKVEKFTKIIFTIKENCTLKIKQIQSESSNKTYEYRLEKNSILEANIFYHAKKINENHILYLSGEKAKATYQIRTIATNQETYFVNVYHENSFTESDIKLKGVGIEEGSIHFDVESTVPKHINNCIVNQDNRIYTFNQNNCTINPVLLIENNDIVANHAAFIGRFDEEVIFYLMSRGISIRECYHLLVKGFLNIDNDEEILTIIHKYWR